MKLEQFKFKKSLLLGYDEEATLKTDKTVSVTILTRKINNETTHFTLQKKIKDNVVYNVKFVELDRLNKALKTISRRK